MLYVIDSVVRFNQVHESDDYIVDLTEHWYLFEYTYLNITEYIINVTILQLKLQCQEIMQSLLIQTTMKQNSLKKT